MIGENRLITSNRLMNPAGRGPKIADIVTEDRLSGQTSKNGPRRATTLPFASRRTPPPIQRNLPPISTQPRGGVGALVPCPYLGPLHQTQCSSAIDPDDIEIDPRTNFPSYVTNLDGKPDNRLLQTWRSMAGQSYWLLLAEEQAGTYPGHDDYTRFSVLLDVINRKAHHPSSPNYVRTILDLAPMKLELKQKNYYDCRVRDPSGLAPMDRVSYAIPIDDEIDDDYHY